VFGREQRDQLEVLSRGEHVDRRAAGSVAPGVIRYQPDPPAFKLFEPVALKHIDSG
jgi:hypothetical protein